MFIIFLKQSLLLLIFFFLFIGWGSLINKILKINFDSYSQRLFYLLTIGLASTIIYVSTLGFLGVLHKPMFLLLVLGFMGLKDFFAKNIKTQEFFIINGIFLFCLTIFPLSFYPPYFGDDVTYHLPIAKSLLEHHEFIIDLSLMYPVFPMAGNSLLVLGLSINPITSQMMSFICLLGLSFACYHVVQKQTSSSIAGILAFSCLISNNLIIFLGSIAYIDLILTLFITASILAFTEKNTKNNTKFLHLSAFFLGIALGIKYTAGIFALAMGIILLFQKKWKDFLKLSSISFLISFPWYFRTFIITGNPTWPFLSNVFDSNVFWNYSDYILQYKDFAYKQLNLLTDNIFYSFWYMHTDNFLSKRINILIWIGLILAFFVSKTKKIKIILCIIFLFLLTWFFSISLTRYIVPVVPLISIVSSIAIYKLLDRFIRKKKLLTLLIIILIFINFNIFYKYLSYRYNSQGVIPTNEKETELYLEKKIPEIKALKEVSQKKAIVYGLYTKNTYFYFSKNIIGNHTGKYRYSGVIDNLDNPNELHDYLEDFGVDYFVINKADFSYIKNYDKKLQLLDSDEFFDKIYYDDDAVIYKLNDKK